MKFKNTKLYDVVLIEPTIFKDDRGSFQESYQFNKFKNNGIELPFVQDNLVFSKKNVLRGLHFQNKNEQGKLVRVLQGEILDVAVDIRKNSPTYGNWISEKLNDENQYQLYIPPGFAHGYLVLSKTALVYYKCTNIYYPEYECGIIWNDSFIGVKWGIENPILSEKDSKLNILQ
jgi:dTDP-4-dehydrorhamnose 3,5-epimerase